MTKGTTSKTVGRGAILKNLNKETERENRSFCVDRYILFGLTPPALCG